MYKNYMTTALRSLLRNKLFSFINIVGLSIGLAACILIMLFVRDEYSWDEHWDRGADTYTLQTTLTFPDREDVRSPGAVDPLKDIFLETYPEIESFTRVIANAADVRIDDTIFREPTVYADHNFVEFFQFDFVEGDPATAMADLKAVVINQTLAKKIFGNQSALGQVITLDANSDYRVAGVIKDVPRTSHMDFSIIVPFNREDFVGARWFTEDWRFIVRTNYIRLKPGSDVALIESQLPALIEQHMPTETGGQESGRGRGMKLHLVPIEDIYLARKAQNGELTTLHAFAGIAVLILAIAIVNFLNLSMARTAYRAREVALRKVVGATPSQIIQQFLAESIVLALIALLFALALVEAALPYYNELLTAFVALDLLAEPTLILGLGLLGVLVGLSAGSMHASYFAMLEPTSVLHTSSAADGGKTRFRRALVIGQFTVSIALMAMAFFVSKQTDYARTMDLGFNPENLVVVSGSSSRSDAFKQRLLESPYISVVGRSSDVPTRVSEDRLGIRPVDGGEKVTLDGLPIDADFFKVYEIPMLAGRHLDAAIVKDILRVRSDRGYNDAANIIVNAMGAKLLGFDTPEAAVNQIVRTDLSADFSFDARIVGVSGDFHFDSARNVKRAGIYYLDQRRQSEMSVRFAGGNFDAGLAAVNAAWQEVFPDQLASIQPMTEMVEEQYQADDQLGRILVAFTFLAILISCLGLFGLASFTVERRTKEIGIRKVLGARYRDISALLLWQFSKPILAAVVIAVPIAVLMLDDWLSGFVYRIDIEAAPFALISLAVLLIGWLTVAGHAFKVARANPIKALRHE